MKFRKILQSQTRVSLKRFSRPLLLDVQYEDALEQFRNHKKTVEKEAGTCHMIEAAESRALTLRNQELQELRKKGMCVLRLDCGAKIHLVLRIILLTYLRCSRTAEDIVSSALHN
jgi:hypothetical protein